MTELFTSHGSKLLVAAFTPWLGDSLIFKVITPTCACETEKGHVGLPGMENFLCPISCKKDCSHYDLSCDTDLLEPTEWPKGSQAPCGVWRETQDCSPGHAGKEDPHLAMTGASCWFSRAAVPVCGF